MDGRTEHWGASGGVQGGCGGRRYEKGEEKMKREREEGRGGEERRGGRSNGEGVMMKGVGGGRVVGVLQFAPNSKEELQTEEDTEEKDQWALMISLPATLLDFYFSGGRGCHGDKYSWLNKAYREK